MNYYNIAALSSELAQPTIFTKNYILWTHLFDNNVRTSFSKISCSSSLLTYTEPGFYEDGSFGIRLETIVGVEKADTPVSHVTYWSRDMRDYGRTVDNSNARGLQGNLISSLNFPMYPPGCMPGLLHNKRSQWTFCIIRYRRVNHFRGIVLILLI